MVRALILSLLLLFPLALQAEPTEQDMAKAVELFNTAEKSYALQEYEEALQNYKEAYRLSEQYELLYNIGQCYRQLDRYDEAIKSYQSFLRIGNVQGELKERVEKLIKESEERKTKQPASTQKTPEPPKEPSLVAPIALGVFGVASLGTAAGLAIRRRIGNAPQIVRARGVFALAGLASLGAGYLLYQKTLTPDTSVSVYSTGATIGLTISW